MNVLIFVSTLLMVMTIMTYARLETFRTSQGFQILFQNYMQKYERAYLNEQQEKRYNTTHISKDKTSEKAPKAPKAKATPRIPLYYLVNKKDRDTHQAEAEQLNILLKKLMVNLYSQQPFFQELEQKRPGFLDEILVAVSKAAEALPEERKIKNAGELANLDLGDQELNEAFYKMLHGAPAIKLDLIKEISETQDLLGIEEKKEIIEENGDPEIAAVDAMEVEEFKSPQGYVSLLDFITTENVPKIRIYLASPIVLKSIFNDDSVVIEILKTRQELFQLITKESPKGELQSTFKNQFDPRRDPTFDDKILDFSISKTNPKKYE